MSHHDYSLSSDQPVNAVFGLGPAMHSERNRLDHGHSVKSSQETNRKRPSLVQGL